MSPGAPTHIVIAGETVELCPERALYWPRRSTLFVADPHWGKAAAFRHHGVAVPRGTTRAGLVRLSSLCARTGAARLVVLGDFFHAAEGRAPDTIEALASWRAAHKKLDVVVVRGNHDRDAGDPPAALNARCLNGSFIEAPFVWSHHPVASAGGYVLSGHVHPGVRLAGAARTSARLACFWRRPEGMVLPAFGEFTGLAIIEPASGDQVYVIAGDDVVPVSLSPL